MKSNHLIINLKSNIKQKNPSMKTTLEEEKEVRKQILKKLKIKFKREDILFLHNNRYLIRDKYSLKVSDGYTVFLFKDKMIDDKGNFIPLANEYNNIFKFTLGLAVVCIKSNTQVVGNTYSQDSKYGLIDVNGKELLPCIFDSIMVRSEGFVEIKLNGQEINTYVTQIIAGEFKW